MERGFVNVLKDSTRKEEISTLISERMSKRQGKEQRQQPQLLRFEGLSVAFCWGCC